MASSSNIDLYVDEAYLLALINEEPLPISDEKYASELHLQEALFNSSSIHPSNNYEIPKFSYPKKEDDDKRFIKQNIEKGESSQAQLIFCNICMENKQTPEIFKGLSNCNHAFCIECVTKYVATKIKDNFAMLECPDPNCKQAIEPESCNTMLPKEVFKRWENALSEAMIPEGQKFYCPYKDCSVLTVDDGGEEVTMSECPSCRRLFCARCKVSWHGGVSCDEYEKLGENERAKEDIMVMKLAKDKKWRRCPNCRIFVEKTDGCHHMKCRCNYEFCYNCGCNWSATHDVTCSR